MLKPILGKFLPICVALGLFLPGCATIQKQPVASALAFQSATLFAIEQSSDRQETARRIIAAAEDAKKLLDFEGVTADQLVARVRERIAQSDRPLSEKAAFNALLVLGEQYINDRIAAGIINPDDKITVNGVLDAVIVAAQAYAG